MMRSMTAETTSRTYGGDMGSYREIWGDMGRDDEPDRAHVAGAEVGPALQEVDAEPALELPLAPLGLIK